MIDLRAPLSDVEEIVTYKGNGAKPTEGKPISEGYWLETFYSWLCANCYTTEVHCF